MSAEAAEATQEPADDADAEETPLAADEMADMDLGGLTEQVQEATGDADGAQDDADTDDAPEPTQEPATTDDDDTDAVGTGFGEMYVGTLAAILASVVDDNGGEKDAEEIAEMARGKPMQLDQHVDALAEEALGETDIPPGKAAVGMTGLLVIMVLIQETDLADDAVNQFGEMMQEARN